MNIFSVLSFIILGFFSVSGAAHAQQSVEGWNRSSPYIQNEPVEQRDLVPEEKDQVKIVSKYKVTDDISGLSYYDKASGSLCHVTLDASLLKAMALSCTQTKTVKTK